MLAAKRKADTMHLHNIGYQYINCRFANHYINLSELK